MHRRSAAAAAALVLAIATPALAQEPAAYVPPPPVPDPTLAVTPAPLPAVTFGATPYERDAPAPPKKEPGNFHLDVGFGTELPISVGGVVTAEVPGRILLQVGLGFMPKGYVNAVDGFLTAVHAYGSSVSDLVRSSLGNSFVLRAGGGWRPFPDHGFEITAGYTLMTMGGSAAGADVINAVLGEGGATSRVPAGAMSADLPIALTLHNVHASLGWRWLLADDHLVIRASLSYIQCLASTAGVDLSSLGATGLAAQPAVNTALNGYLNPFFTTYVKAPTLGLSMAYRF